MSPMSTLPSAAPTSTGGRLVTPDGTQLAFRGCSLDVDASGGLARVILRQTFFNDFDEALQVTYQVPLPADAAVGGYAFELDGRRISGEIESHTKARQKFEDAVLEGKTAALLEQDRSSVFTQEIGNVPPRSEVTCELILDQKLRWLGDSQWEWRFPTVIAPRYMGAEGRVPDRDKVAVEVLERGHDATAQLALIIRDPFEGDASSPSHSIRSSDGSDGRLVSLSDDDGTRLDRDVVVRWSGALPTTGVSVHVARPSEDRSIAESAYALLTITPPASAKRFIPRDLIILIDTSGSMDGEPLDQAKDVVSHLIESLNGNDTLELIEFSMSAKRWRKTARAASKSAKKSALAWVESLNARGGTEMQNGLIEALSPIRDDAQRQVILISDGLVGFEHDLVNIVKERVSSGTRVHSVGVGPAANRSLTSAIARAGGGAEFLVGLEENADEVVSRIIGRVSQPLMQGLRIEGSALRECGVQTLPDLMAGCPSMIPVRIAPEGGDITVRGMTSDGMFEHSVAVPPCEYDTGSESVVRLFGRERAEDLDASVPAGTNGDQILEKVGLDYRIATRCTSWVAISEEATVDPTEPIRRTKIAQSLPAGLSAEGLGLRRIEDTACLARRMSPAFMPENYMAAPAERSTRYSIAYSLDEVRRPTESKPETLRVAGILVSLEDGRAIIEIELHDEIDWQPRGIEIAGSPNATIDKKATTRRSTYEPGERLRLVIENLAADLDALEEVVVICGPRSPRLHIDLDPA